MRPPDGLEHLMNAAFFLVMNGILLGAAWAKGRRSTPGFRAAYFLAVAPLVIMVWSLSWQWLFDVTAANLWPLGMMLLAFPCGIAWLIVLAVEQRTRRRVG